ncbi:hypothetical protein D9M68_830040 [compost metagenome]
MPFGQIDHMDVVTNPRTVLSGVVVSENRKLLKLPDRHLANVRQEVIGDSVGVFTNQPTFMGTHGIEVPQQCNAPAGVGVCEIAQQLLDHQLRAAVRVCRCAGREILADRHLFRFAIHSCR